MKLVRHRVLAALSLMSWDVHRTNAAVYVCINYFAAEEGAIRILVMFREALVTVHVVCV
jgi:hypothetical protein